MVRIKKVVGVSIGPSSRDHTLEIELGGEMFTISRVGTDGSIERAAQILGELDGKVDAFGMGGIDMYLKAAGRRYYFRDAKKLKAAAGNTPIVDGSGLKGAVEAGVVRHLIDECGLEFKGKKALVTSAVDRWGMAQALRDAGCEMAFGDLMFALGLPFPIRRWSTLVACVKVVTPVAVQLPFAWLYQSTNGSVPAPEPKPSISRLYRWADVIAGDWHYIKRHMPEDMTGKWIITNTTTADDVELCRSRGVELLVTSTPRLEGRSFGTNVIEAALVALDGRQGELSEQRYLELLASVGFRPDIQRFGI